MCLPPQAEPRLEAGPPRWLKPAIPQLAAGLAAVGLAAAAAAVGPVVPVVPVAPVVAPPEFAAVEPAELAAGPGPVVEGGGPVLLLAWRLEQHPAICG